MVFRAFAAILLTAACACVDADLNCMECYDSPSPFLCGLVTTCGSHQSCAIEQVVTSGGLILYNQGCRSTSHCSKREIHVSVRQRPVSTTDIITCIECCNGDYCNLQGCGQRMSVPPDRPPMCFSCDYQASEDSCRDVTLCDDDEVCLLYKPLTTVPLLSSRCARKTQCANIAKRDAVTSNCPYCCATDFCNNQCAHNTSIGTTSTNKPTTAVIAPTKPPIDSVLVQSSTASTSFMPSTTTFKSWTTTERPLLTGTIKTTHHQQATSDLATGSSTTFKSWTTTERPLPTGTIKTTHHQQATSDLATGSSTTFKSWTTTERPLPTGTIKTTHHQQATSDLATGSSTTFKSWTTTERPLSTTSTTSAPTTQQTMTTTKLTKPTTTTSIKPTTQATKQTDPTTKVNSLTSHSTTQHHHHHSTEPRHTTVPTTPTYTTKTTQTTTKPTHGTHTTASTMATTLSSLSGCNTKLDMCFVIPPRDGATGALNKTRAYISKLIDGLDIGPNGTHVCVVKYYGSSTSVAVKFTPLLDKSSLKLKIADFKPRQGPYVESKGIYKARLELQSSKDGARVDANKLMIVFTADKLTFSQYQHTLVQANIAKQIGKVFVVAVGDNLNATFIYEIASDIRHTRLHDNYDELVASVPPIIPTMDSVCPGCSHTPKDIVFALESTHFQTALQFRTMVDFVTHYVTWQFNIGPSMTQVSSITYNSHVRTNFFLNQLSTTQQLANGFKSIQYSPGTHPKPGDALHHAMYSILTSANGARHHSEKIIVLFTHTGNAFTHGMPTVTTLKQHNVRLIVVGIGQVDHTLSQLAALSDAGKGGVLNAPEESDLHTILNQLTVLTCQK